MAYGRSSVQTREALLAAPVFSTRVREQVNYSAGVLFGLVVWCICVLYMVTNACGGPRRVLELCSLGAREFGAQSFGFQTL